MAESRNSDLIEELGQVEFIFSDKTGTLTQNKMVFRKFTVGGQAYGVDTCDKECKCQGMCKKSVDQVLTELLRMYDDPSNKPLQHSLELHNFFTLLSVCHTVVVDHDPATLALDYQASSPDELALINGARQLGFVLKHRDGKTLTIENTLEGVTRTYEVHAEFPFDSDRKRMSLIVEE